MIEKIKALLSKSYSKLAIVAGTVTGTLLAGVANAQSFDLTPSASTTDAISEVETVIDEFAGEALAFVIGVFREMWYWFLLIGAIFFVIRWLRNTGGHK